MIKWLSNRSMWIRVILCLLTANLFWRALDSALLVRVDRLLYDQFLGTAMYPYRSPSNAVSIVFVWILCMAPARFVVDRPWVTLLSGFGMAGAYLVVAFGAMAFSRVAYPVTIPLFGLITSTGVMETLSWSKEVSRRRRMEALERARERFADMLVHDVKNRIAAALTAFGLVEKQLETAGVEADGRVAQTVRVSLQRVVLQLAALLDIRRMQEGRLALRRERLNLEDLVARAVNEYGPTANLLGVGLAWTPSDTPARVWADPTIAGRVIANLLWNALRFAPRASDVRISTGADDSGGWLCVENAGDPIPSDLLPTLFDAFSADKIRRPEQGEEGVGLGLAFCKLAVDAHGGRIRVESPRPAGVDGVSVRVSFPGSVT